MIRPTSGSGAVLGKDITDSAESRELRRRVAYVAEDKPLYGYMTVEQIIRFAKSFYPDWRTDVEKKLLLDYELPIERKVKTLSKGMRTKLALLLAFSRRPDLVILDEPSEGLDPVGIEYLLSSLVTQAAEGVSIFFSSHRSRKSSGWLTMFAFWRKAACLLTNRSMNFANRIGELIWYSISQLLSTNSVFRVSRESRPLGIT